MNKLIKLLLALSLAAPVFAQNSGLPARVPGTVGNCVKIGTNNVETDNGSACAAGGGTSVSQNSGSTETTLPVTGYMPQVCSDSSGSGTAQVCTVANSFTPQTGNCVVYKTTTANSGAGLTVNVDSLGAKSVAVAGSSGWTTTLVASSSIPANKPMNLCYDGTNWNASGTGFVPVSGSSSRFPFTVVQETFTNSGSSNVTSATITFPQTTAASGNTVFMLIATDGSQTITLPSGWTADFNQIQASFARLILLHKTSASDTSATFTTSSATNYAIWMFELSGTRSLDVSSLGGSANNVYIVTPSITPTAGSLVFNAACFVTGTQSVLLNNWQIAQPSLNGDWQSFGETGANGLNGSRVLAGFSSRYGAAGTAITPPLINMAQWTLFASGGVAYATFSIK